MMRMDDAKIQLNNNIYITENQKLLTRCRFFLVSVVEG
jgi:hypothetical protein